MSKLDREELNSISGGDGCIQASTMDGAIAGGVDSAALGASAGAADGAFVFAGIGATSGAFQHG